LGVVDSLGLLHLEMGFQVVHMAAAAVVRLGCAGAMPPAAQAPLV
jgi:hypothetical protein